MADDWFDKNDPAKADTTDWFAQNDPDTTSLVRQHVRGKPKKKPLLQSLAENQNVGGLLGPAGGMLSEGLKMSGEIPPGSQPSAEEANQAFEQNVGRLLGAGGQQVGLNAAGNVLSNGVGLVGRGLMATALKATPEVAQTALKEGIAATGRRVSRTLTTGGLGKVMGKLREAGGYTKSLVRKATTQGSAYHPTEVLHGTEGLVGASFPEEDVKLLQELNDRFLKNHGNRLTPVSLHEIKQELDNLAKPIYRKIDGAKMLDTARLTEQRWAKQVADNARQLLNQTVEGYADANARTEALIALKNAVFPAAKRGVAQRLVAGGVSGTAGAAIGAAASPGNRAQGAGIGAGAGIALSSPAVLSYLALAANNPALRQFLKYLPRAGASGYEALGE